MIAVALAAGLVAGALGMPAGAQPLVPEDVTAKDLAGDAASVGAIGLLSHWPRAT